MKPFDGRAALITGASAGIGAALAREFARQGADVAILARRAERLHALAEELRRGGRRAVPIAADVTRDGDLEQAVRAAREALGRLDVVVANAGFGVVGLVESLTMDDYRRQFETNVFGVLRTVHATLDELKRTRGCLVLIGSVSGHIALAGGSAYAMSKFALRALAQSLRLELAPHAVAVVLISPGFVESELHQVDNRGVWHPEARSQVPGWLRMSTAKAARQIVRAVHRRSRERVITAHGKAAVFLQRHAPWLVAAVAGAFSLRSRRPVSPRPE